MENEIKKYWWDEEIKYPFKFAGFTMYKEYGICDTCRERIDGGGIIAWSSHWAKCAGKDQVDRIFKIRDMPLQIDDKMDLIKNEFGINQ